MDAEHARRVRQFLQDIFSYALPLDVASSGGPDLTEQQAVDALIVSPLRHEQTYALACYLMAVPIIEPESKARVATLLDAITLRPDEKATIQRAIGQVVRRNKPTALALYREPPPAFVDTVNQMVIDAFGKQHLSKALRDLHPDDFTHPLEQSGLTLISRIPGLSQIVAKIIDLSKRADEVLIMADGLVVNERSQPTLAGCYRHVTQILGLTHPPPLYMHGTGYQLRTIGADAPAITIPSMVTTFFEMPELQFLLGRELGHVIARHVHLRTCAQFALNASDSAASITLGLLRLPLDALMNNNFYGWMRASELTADRCGLLACQDIEAALRALMKLSGYPMRYAAEINTTALIEQAERFRWTIAGNTLDRQLAWLGNIGRDNHYVVIRAAELLGWINSGDYATVLNRKEAKGL